MKLAILAGSTGLVGRSVAKQLNSKGVKLICLGSKSLNRNELINSFGFEPSYYLDIPMERLKELPNILTQMKMLKYYHEIVFFNFAWRGEKRLTDGDLRCQLKNATFSAEAVKIAKIIGCNKFINVGSIEETKAEMWVKDSSSIPFQSSQTNYALSKLASRDASKMTAYLEKIDYIHTRISVPLDLSLNSGNYIAKSLSQIARGCTIESPRSLALYDIVSTKDLGNAFYSIAMQGKNLSDYYIGNSMPAKLASIFQYFESKINGKLSDLNIEEDRHDIFSSKSITEDTGFKAKENLHYLAQLFTKIS